MITLLHVIRTYIVFSIVAAVVLTAELSRASSAHSGAPWLIKLGYLCIQEILVVTKTSVPTSVCRCDRSHFKAYSICFF